ncbi:MAG TPA: glycosyl hydrolase [Gemmatimonadaceae bacterium]|nr:glycosyl hydrolase [Gemmatimonadaceae bacterium]
MRTFVGRVASVVALLTIGLAARASAQRASSASPSAWPAITRDVKPWTRWWWLGSAVDKQNITEQLGQLAAAGFGGVEVTVIYGAKGADSAYIPYLSPRWVEMLAHTATEAHRRGMGVDLPQGSGWRMGGPSVAPDDVNASLAITVDSVSSGGTWRKELPSHRVNAIVAVGEAGQRLRIPFTASAGTVEWKAPAGRWVVYVAGTRFSGDNVKRPAPGGEGPSLDPFSETATAHYLAMFAAKTASLPKGAIRSYFHDSFEYTGDGSIGLFDFFRARRGYDLADELPALAGRADADRVARVQSDYRQTLDEMLLEHFVQQLTRWSHGRGSLMREQAHGSPANLLDLYAAADIPETEIFGVLGSPDADPLINMFASSAAHVAGKRLASAESFTWLGEHFTGTLDDVKHAADRMFLAGINHLVYHGTAYSPAQAAWPGWQFYASMEFNPRNAFWRDVPAFNQYVARVQSVLQAGRPDNDVLLYWPIWDNWHDASRRRMDFRVHDPVWFHGKPFGQAARSLHEAGYGVDYVSDRQLSGDISATGGRVRSKGGEYAMIVVPNAVHLPPATMRRLLALARAGATVAFVGALPSDVPGLARLAERRAELAGMQRALDWKATRTGLREARVGKGRVMNGDRLEQLLEAAKVRHDPLADYEDLQFLRRKIPGGSQHFIVAQDSFATWVPVAGRPRAVVLMDPMTGRTGLALTDTTDGKLMAFLQLEKGQSIIMRALDRRPSAVELWQYSEPSASPVALRGTWSVAFIDGGPVFPKPFTADTPMPWTGRGDDDADRFAGTARYSITFDAPDTEPLHELLLGRVAESARVRLNGRDLGVAFSSPYRVETGPLRRTGNLLEIEVTNVSANRIRDLDRRGVEWKIFRDINFVGIDYKPFDASRWPVRTSGLIGPVTLRTLYDMKGLIKAVQ